MLYNDQRAQKFLNSQRNVDSMHVKWTNFLQRYSFVIKHMSRPTNCVADALSRQLMLLTALQEEIFRLKFSKDLYKEEEEDFGEI